MLWMGGNKKSRGFKYFEERCIVHKRKHDRLITRNKINYQKKLYRNAVTKYTRRSIKQHGLENLHLVDKYNYNIDHIFPIIEGYKRNVPPSLIGHINNLRVVEKIHNIKKRSRILLDLIDTELFKDYI